MKNLNSIAAIIPALNEEQSISFVIDATSKYAGPIVIDDGSSDRTAEIAASRGAHVVSHQINRGYESALETGFEKAKALGFKYVITLDADGQHDPQIISVFEKKLIEGYDVVVGVRNKMQRIGERIFSIVSRASWGIHDPLCGMKAYRSEILNSINFRFRYDSVGTKYLIASAIAGCKIFEIPIETKSRKGNPRFGAGWNPNRRILLALIHSVRYATTKNSTILYSNFIQKLRQR